MSIQQYPTIFLVDRLYCLIPDIELYDDVTILTEQYPIDVEVQFNYIYPSESLF